MKLAVAVSIPSTMPTSAGQSPAAAGLPLPSGADRLRQPLLSKPASTAVTGLPIQTSLVLAAGNPRHSYPGSMEASSTELYLQFGAGPAKLLALRSSSLWRSPLAFD